MISLLGDKGGKLLSLLQIYSTFEAEYDIKATCTSPKRPVPQLGLRQPKTSTPSSHGKIQKKNHRASLWPGATPPPKRLGLFFSLDCGSKLFSQPLQRGNNRPRVPREHWGGRAWRERGIRHTARTRGQPVGKENAKGDDRKEERKRTRSLHLKGVFSFQTRALALW